MPKESSRFSSCLTPSLPWLQITYWRKVSLKAFRQILPKMLSLVNIFSFIITTCLKSSLQLNPLIQNSVQQNYLPEFYPMYPHFIKNVWTALPLPSNLPFRRNPVDEGKIPQSTEKENAHFPYQKKCSSPNSNFYVITQYKLYLWL